MIKNAAETLNRDRQRSRGLKPKDSLGTNVNDPVTHLGQCVHLAIFACALLAMLGCESSRGLGYRLGENSDAKRDLLSQLDQAEKKWVQARAEIDRAQSQAEQLKSQLASRSEVEVLLQQRVDNLLKENQQITQELTASVMNGVQPTSGSNLSNVSSTSPADVTIPKSVERSLMALQDHYSGVQFNKAENVVRIASSEIYSNGDAIKPSARQLLTEVADILNGKDAKAFNIMIVAHAPPNASVPKELVAEHPTIWHLTAHQAIAVQQDLEENGVSPTRIGIVSYAHQQPLITAPDGDSQSKNARVEIFFTPPDPSS